MGPGPSHHRLSSNSSNGSSLLSLSLSFFPSSPFIALLRSLSCSPRSLTAPNPNLLPSNPYTHPRRPSTSDAQAQAPPFPPLFAPADCWSPGGDELDYELEEARRSRERRKDEERQLRKERERERERERSRQDENEDDEQEESASKRRSLRKRREREEEERERERGRKRERRDSGLEEGEFSFVCKAEEGGRGRRRAEADRPFALHFAGTVSRRRDGGSRSRESSAAAGLPIFSSSSSLK